MHIEQFKHTAHTCLVGYKERVGIPMVTALTSQGMSKYFFFCVFTCTPELVKGRLTIHQTSPTPREYAHRWRLPNLVVLGEWKVPVEGFMGAANSFH